MDRIAQKLRGKTSNTTASTTNNAAEKSTRCARNHRRPKQPPLDDNGCEELMVATVGNVNSGKSTLVGVLTYGMLDDGNGAARLPVMRHPHEQTTGRTSDISYTYVKHPSGELDLSNSNNNSESSRIYTFIDLAGHEQYLRTTISGLTTGYSDVAFVCISNVITKITLEHINLLASLEIPMVLLFTRTDIVPQDVYNRLIQRMTSCMTSNKRKLFRIETVQDIERIPSLGIVPYMQISCKTGYNIDMIWKVLSQYKKITRSLPCNFSIDHVYHIQGYGTVLSGISGITINKGDKLYIGPFQRGAFVPLEVRTLHNDYRMFVDQLPAGKRGSMSIRLPNKSSGRKGITRGMIVVQEPPKNLSNKFRAKLRIIHHHTSIAVGYQVFANCGMVGATVRFLELIPLTRTGEIDKQASGTDSGSVILRSGQLADVTMEFINDQLHFLEVGQKIIFREGHTKGIGKIIELL